MLAMLRLIATTATADNDASRPATPTASSSTAPACATRLTRPSSSARAEPTVEPSSANSIARAVQMRRGALRASGTRHQPRPHLGQPEAGARIGEDRVAQQRQLESSSHGVSLDGCENRVRQRRPAIKCPARAAEMVPGPCAVAEPGGNSPRSATRQTSGCQRR